MAVGPAFVARASLAGRATSRPRLLERESVFSWVMLAPGVLFLLAFVAYPFVYGIFISLQDRRVASPGTFVGLANFVAQAHDAVFWQVTRNTFIYTIVATFLKMTGGLAMALVINQQFRGKNLARALLLLPFIVPTAPYEAAAIAGASVTQRFWHITIPVIMPVLIIVTMFSVIFTFSDFQLPYILTHGGPANATHLFATYAFDIGMSAGQIGMGAAVALAMLPALGLLIVFLTLYLRRE